MTSDYKDKLTEFDVPCWVVELKLVDGGEDYLEFDLDPDAEVAPDVDFELLEAGSESFWVFNGKQDGLMLIKGFNARELLSFEIYPGESTGETGERVDRDDGSEAGFDAGEIQGSD